MSWGKAYLSVMAVIVAAAHLLVAQQIQIHGLPKHSPWNEMGKQNNRSQPFRPFSLLAP
jgi:hypothetical protein